LVVYLLLARQWRAAATAGTTAAVGTILAAVVAPDETRTYFTEALWDTARIGQLDYISNQSLMGVVARLGLPHLVWAVAVVAVFVVWMRRSRSAHLRTGFAVTAAVSCLLSPITWVHHLVWLVPALAVLLASTQPRMRRAGIAAYAVLVSSLVWLWSLDRSGVLGLVGGNAYLWVSLALLVICGSVRSADRDAIPDKVLTGAPLEAQSPIEPSPLLSRQPHQFSARRPGTGDSHRDQPRQQVGRAS
jgi:alpha-1,2-mannosyltransferase